mmetsp:Transcript_94397/g.158471  ORF Transcript_94397/g.158471 Transcript_94397/m.158471 type:complete len:113 (-) Transcript_94397:1003-1341(-)
MVARATLFLFKNLYHFDSDGQTQKRPDYHFAKAQWQPNCSENELNFLNENELLRHHQQLQHGTVPLEAMRKCTSHRKPGDFQRKPRNIASGGAALHTCAEDSKTSTSINSDV